MEENPLRHNAAHYKSIFWRVSNHSIYKVPDKNGRGACKKGRVTSPQKIRLPVGNVFERRWHLTINKVRIVKIKHSIITDCMSQEIQPQTKLNDIEIERNLIIKTTHWNISKKVQVDGTEDEKWGPWGNTLD